MCLLSESEQVFFFPKTEFYLCFVFVLALYCTYIINNQCWITPLFSYKTFFFFVLIGLGVFIRIIAVESRGSDKKKKHLSALCNGNKLQSQSFQGWVIRQMDRLNRNSRCTLQSWARALLRQFSISTSLSHQPVFLLSIKKLT